ncbi:MAG TPA: hypothetical protein VG269_16450 [Tepidisphaeraceae bacterium]|jgi:hypothetical protein|nr:hypothetical protein [Tepidisphaeraceae bacterium]
MNRYRLYTLIVAFVALALSRQGHAADYSDPKKTLRTFWGAIKADDMTTVKACMAVSDGNKSAMLDFLADSWTVPHQCAKAAAAKFGKLPDAFQHDCPSDKDLDEALVRLSNARVRTAKDRALVEPDNADGELTGAPLSEKAIPLIKVGGEWKIDVDLLVGIDDPAAAMQKATVMVQAYQGMKQILADIISGKFHAADDVDKAMSANFNAAYRDRSASGRRAEPGATR